MYRCGRITGSLAEVRQGGEGEPFSSPFGCNSGGAIDSSGDKGGKWRADYLLQYCIVGVRAACLLVDLDQTPRIRLQKRRRCTKVL